MAVTDPRGDAEGTTPLSWNGASIFLWCIRLGYFSGYCDFLGVLFLLKLTASAKTEQTHHSTTNEVMRVPSQGFSSVLMPDIFWPCTPMPRAKWAYNKIRIAALIRSRPFLPLSDWPYYTTAYHAPQPPAVGWHLLLGAPGRLTASHSTEG